jgi:hypothetical protein
MRRVQTLRGIHAELADFNKEEAEPAAKIHSYKGLVI